jgi:predicted chitinase
MRAQEFIIEEQLDEGWREQLANLAMAGTIAATGTGALMAKQALTSPKQAPQAAAAVTAPAPKQDVKPVTQPAPKTSVAKAGQTKPKKVDVKPITGNKLEYVLLKTAKDSGIKGTELAAFMAQCAHETLDFKTLREIGGSLDFRKYDPKHAPKKARALGNKYAGDGARYKGRGYIQLTGRDNYRRAGQELNLPLEKHPELAEKPEIAAQIAVWFWKHRVQPNVDNYHDVTDVTKPINPSLNGLQDRKENFKSYMQVAMK